MIDFIGLGAQKAGTSWVYACLYEHPEICAPIKEIHFFSRLRFTKGKEWYEEHFKNCHEGTKKGEFSTSYLYSEETPERIKTLYHNAKLIAILRNPIDRAYSQYRNSIKAGEIEKTMSFYEFRDKEESCLKQGLYARQLERYFDYFQRDKILICIYEDIRKDPLAFMYRIYDFLGVDTTFIPSMLHREINTARTPRLVVLDRFMHLVAETLRKVGFDKVVWLVKKSGITDAVRKVNTEEDDAKKETFDRTELVQYFKNDVEKLSTLIGRDMNKEWGI